MSKQFKRGLVVGKFAPPHLGHILMIEEACRLCEQVDVFVYSNPDLPAFESRHRANIMEREIHRHNMMNKPFGATLRVWAFTERDGAPPNGASAWLHHEWIKGRYDFYLNHNTGAKAWKPPDAVIGSEEYIPEFARSLGATPVQLERIGGINGSTIRANPYGHLDDLPESSRNYYFERYAEKVVFVGAESTGKSTTAFRCATDLNGAYIPEYGAEVFRRQGGVLTDPELWEEIVDGQTKREDAAVKDDWLYKYIFCDTEAITTKYFMYWMLGYASEYVKEAASNSAKRYKHWFLCDDGIPFDGSNMRGPEEVRKVHQGMLKMMLNEAGIEYITLRGSTEDRVAKVNAVLQERRRRDWKEL